MRRVTVSSLYVAAAFGVTVGLVFQESETEAYAGVAISAVLFAVALALSRVRRTVPDAVYHVVNALGTLAVTAALATNVSKNTDDEMFYLWTPLFAFYFFPLRGALAHLTLTAVAYAAVIATRPDAAPEDSVRWFVTLTTITVAGLLMRYQGRFQQTMIEQLAVSARTDPLTGLLNRDGFAETLSAQMSRAQRQGVSFGLVLSDIDHFKKINDTHGHGAGDEVLRRVSGVLAEATRGSDRPARLGGEEFAVLASNADAKESLEIAERLRHLVLATGEPHPVTMSFGVAVYPDDAVTADDLLACADRALYRAKTSGRNQSALHCDGAAPI